MNPSSVGTARVRACPKARAVVQVAACIFGSGLMALYGQTVANPNNKPGKPSQALLMVRSWDPQTGLLTGWLPMHQTVLELEALDPSAGIHFSLNDAIQLRWPVRPKRVPEVGGIHVTPDPRTFEGKMWVPAKREPNLVQIGRRYYLIRTITFVESSPAAPASAENAAQGEWSFRPR